MAYWDSIASAAQAPVPGGFTYSPGQGALDPSVQSYYQNNPLFTAGYQAGQPVTSSGYVFRPTFNPIDGNAESGQTGGDLSGYTVYDGKPWYDGQTEYLYDPSGKFLRAQTIEKPNSDFISKYGWVVPALASAGAAAGMFGASGAAGGAGGFVGEGAASGIPAWDAAAAGGAPITAGSGAVAAGGAGASQAAIDAAAQSAGSGLAGSGTGLSLGGGTQGLAGTLGTGYELAGGGGVGIGASAPGASSLGAGLGASEYAAGTGSLLSPSVLQAAGAGASMAAMGAGAAGGGSGVVPPNPYATTPGGTVNVPGIGSVPTSLLTTGLTAGLTALGGANAASAAGKAADAQLESVRESNALLKQIYDDQKSLQEPFRQAGVTANNRLQELLGIGGNASAPDYGSAGKDWTFADMNSDPGYQFRQSEGEKALQRRLSAGGDLYSGKAMKDAMNYNQGIASDEAQNSFNRYQSNRAAKLNPLQSMAGAGQSSANTLTSAAGNYGSQVSGNIQAGSNAQAAGTVGQANAWNNALQQGMSMYSQNQLMNALLQPRTY